MLLVFTWPPHGLPSPQPALQLPGTFLRAPRFLLPPWVSSSFPLPPPSTQAKPPLTLPSFSCAFSPSIHPLPQNGPSTPSRIVPGRYPSRLCKRKRRSGPGLLTVRWLWRAQRCCDSTVNMHRICMQATELHISLTAQHLTIFPPAPN